MEPEVEQEVGLGGLVIHSVGPLMPGGIIALIVVAACLMVADIVREYRRRRRR